MDCYSNRNTNLFHSIPTPDDVLAAFREWAREDQQQNAHIKFYIHIDIQGTACEPVMCINIEDQREHEVITINDEPEIEVITIDDDSEDEDDVVMLN